MIINIHMLAYMDKGNVRKVLVKDDVVKSGSLDTVLSAVFMYGQNTMQPQPMPSASVGDVIEFPSNEYHMIMPVGFKTIDKKEFDSYKGKLMVDREFFHKIYS